MWNEDKPVNLQKIFIKMKLKVTCKINSSRLSSAAIQNLIFSTE